MAPVAGRQRSPSPGSTLDEFNAAEPDTAAEILGACLDIPEWVDAVSAGRPYAHVESLRATAGTAAGRITWQQVAGALDRHPRIGEKTAAVAATSTEADWSSSEQSGVLADQAAALAAGNRAYEDRFGYIFLICAAGLSGEQILANLNTRLTDDPETEKSVVMAELRKIAALRLAKAVSD